jgi:prophage regulatory protein
MHQILKLPEVMSRTGLSRASIYAFMAKGSFPSSIKLGPRSSGWLESEIQEWIQALIDKQRI